MESDIRQLSIVYQNQSRLAFDILVFNLKNADHLVGTSLELDPKDVVDLALKLTQIAMNPIPHMQKQRDSK